MFVLVVALLGYRSEKHSEKTVWVSGKVQGNEVVPMGNTVGIYVNTKGVLVIDTGEVTDIHGKNSTPAKNKLMQGDYIIGLNDQPIKTKKELVEKITHCNGETLVFQVNRKDEEIKVKVEPVQADVDLYKVGIWVKDDLQGLGTITYVTDDSFAALGHSVNDTDTGEILSVSGGEVYEADIFGVEKGVVGTPGEIEGMIAYQTENIVGHIENNQLYGIYGELTEDYKEEVDGMKALEVANSDEVKIGKAKIQSYVSGKRELYEIEIVDFRKNDNGDKEMEIVVKDKELIDLTGGIVQGMSGSPIIQDGKIIGAVTHVLVNDPTRGYAIFIENMLEH